jgi:hypothetical protein
MSSNGSRRPPPLLPPLLDPPELLDWPDDRPLEPPDELDPLPDPVEYFVEVVLDSWVWTSVPKSTQLSHTSSSAPSTLMVLGDDVSAPHISH